LTETPALVTRVEDGTAWVASKAPSSCGACGGKGCGSSLFSRFWHPDEPEYRVDNPIGAGVGDAVVVGVPDGALLRAALASYGMPLLLLLGGAGLGNFLFGEPGAIGGGLCGLGLAGVWLKLHRGPDSTPVILRRDADSGLRVCGTRTG
jgi:sigma-E factor negative regulatory protein RseC